MFLGKVSAHLPTASIRPTTTNFLRTLNTNFFSTDSTTTVASKDEGIAPIGEEVKITLNGDDPTPTIQPYDAYPEWLQQLPDTEKTIVQLNKEFEVYSAAQERGEDSEMEYKRIMRLYKLTNRTKIKGQNETANDL
jgi:hypothetical protein